MSPAGAPRPQPAPDPLVGAWLIVIAVMVVGMILLGGATRLTDSGLSITEWRPVTGAIPPLSAADWARAFALYQQTTEYQAQNAGMSLGEFQFIYWWEWAHRFLGRAIGVVFAVPFLIFWRTGRLKGRFAPILILFALGGLQGAVGWWMVSSGLVGRLDVAPQRLATHLGLAFLILGFAVWLALEAFGWPKEKSRLGGPRWALPVFLAVLFLQILLGAFVAGVDAGRAYSDWPTIGGDLFPRTYAQLQPFWRNWVENHAAIQFNHRVLGYVVALLALHLAAVGWRRGEGQARVWAPVLGLIALVQAALGVATILAGAPLDLSLAHQGVAITLWVDAIVLLKASGIMLPYTQAAEITGKTATP